MWCLLLELVGVVDLEDSRISTELPQGSPAKTHDAFHAVEVVLYFGTLTYEPAKCLMVAGEYAVIAQIHTQLTCCTLIM